MIVWTPPISRPEGDYVSQWKFRKYNCGRFLRMRSRKLAKIAEIVVQIPILPILYYSMENFGNWTTIVGIFKANFCWLAKNTWNRLPISKIILEIRPWFQVFSPVLYCIEGKACHLASQKSKWLGDKFSWQL